MKNWRICLAEPPGHPGLKEDLEGAGARICFAASIIGWRCSCQYRVVCGIRHVIMKVVWLQAFWGSPGKHGQDSRSILAVRAFVPYVAHQGPQEGREDLDGCRHVYSRMAEWQAPQVVLSEGSGVERGWGGWFQWG